MTARSASGTTSSAFAPSIPIGRPAFPVLPIATLHAASVPAAISADRFGALTWKVMRSSVTAMLVSETRTLPPITVIALLLSCSSARDETLNPSEPTDASCAELVAASGSCPYLALSPEETNAIVALEWLNGNGVICSGVVVGASSVLTARHCIDLANSENMEVVVGPSLACPEGVFQGHVSATHESMDLAIVHVSALASAGLEPIIWNDQSIDDTWIGKPLALAGFGTNGHDNPDLRGFVVEPVAKVSDDTVSVDGMGRSGACGGDSGGPLLTRGPAGTPVVVGLLSDGSGSCVGQDHFVRLDAVSDWLRSNVDAVPARKICGGIDSKGRCYNGVAVYCDGATITGQPCTRENSCAW